MPPFTTPPVALVTGCSSGFGLLTAVDLAVAGFRTVATMRNTEMSGAVTDAAKAAGTSVIVLPLDVTDAASIGSCMEETRSRAGAVDVLVNNAGFALAGYAEDVSDAELREQLDTNFFGSVAVTRAVIPEMRARHSGRIITISSVAGLFGSPGLGAYCASKWAVEGWFESLRYELLPYSVFVSLVEPGVYPTEIFGSNRRIAARASDPSSPHRAEYQRMAERFEAQLKTGHATPEEVAETVVRVAQSAHPRLRYPVGKGSRAAATLGPLTPEWLMERIRMWLMKR